MQEGVCIGDWVTKGIVESFVGKPLTSGVDDRQRFWKKIFSNLGYKIISSKKEMFRD